MMKHIVCPTCFHRFRINDAQLCSVIPCPKCGLSLDCKNAVVPDSQGESSGQLVLGEKQEITPKMVVGIVIIPMVLLILISFSSSTSSRPSPPSSSFNESKDSSEYGLSRDDAIDEFVDREVGAHWRPMPGGNSKEDAKILTRDVLKARTWEEFEAAVIKNAQEGR